MRDLEVGRHATDATAGEIRFEELADIHTRFHAMAEAIRSREQSLAEATVKAQAASLAKSAFLASMSHEIRTPLNAILGFAQVLGRDPELKRGQRESLATIERSGEYLLTLINDILDMAKIEAGRMTLQTAPFDLRALLDETESLFKQRAHDRALRLSIEQVELPRIVQGDATKLRQVLLNLVGNAVKFTSVGTVKLRAERVGEALIRFSVEDTGVGIAPEELTRIFEPFTQTESGRQVQGGTGLGLALSAQFVRLMGGELTATSVPGQGSCFSFTLRLPPGSGAEPAVAMEVESEVVGLEPGQPVCRILIVDDLADNRAPLRALLEGVNPHPPVLELREAADGREALAIWEDWQPHLIFMDMRMPVMSGQEATSQIKSRMAERPDRVRSVIVALSANAFDEQRDHFLASGCDEFARKPFRSEEIFDILERLAGVRLSRAAAAEAAETLSTAAASERLCAYPDEWRSALKRALDIGDFVRIEGLLEQIKGRDAALERSLQGWARNYDLDALSTVLNACGDRAGTGEAP
jgi:signal transduction histidine kinase/CheY-like chemotaxis protein